MNNPETKQDPYLVVTAGFPCAGKSTLSKYLKENLGFVHISTDEIRQKLWNVGGSDYSDFQKTPFFNEKEQMAFNYLHILKIENLQKGKDLVIDAASFYNDVRQYFFNTKTYLANGDVINLPAQKYLLHLDITPEEVIKRNKAKLRTNDVYNEWKDNWEAPLAKDYTLLKFNNNTKSDLEFLLSEVDKTFSRS